MLLPSAKICSIKTACLWYSSSWLQEVGEVAICFFLSFSACRLQITYEDYGEDFISSEKYCQTIKMALTVYCHFCNTSGCVQENELLHSTKSQSPSTRFNWHWSDLLYTYMLYLKTGKCEKISMHCSTNTLVPLYCPGQRII